jgi:hypothetical protein
MYDRTGNNWHPRNNDNTFKENLEAIPIKQLVDSLQEAAKHGTSHIIRKVLQCETGSLSVRDHRWFKRFTRKKRPVTRDIIK